MVSKRSRLGGGPKIQLEKSGVAGRGLSMAGSHPLKDVLVLAGGQTAEAPAGRAEGQAGNTEGCSARGDGPASQEAALMGEWQVPAR